MNGDVNVNVNRKGDQLFEDLKTITDFDFAVGGPNKHFIRVSEVVPNVTDSEVNLIIWLLLEKEFKSKKNSPGFTEKYADDDVDAEVDDPDGNVFSRRLETDNGRGFGSSGDHSDSTRQLRYNNQIGYGVGRLKQSKKYAEDLLQAVGINIPFQLLTGEERNRVFSLFCSSSNLLLQESYSSILDLYEALRRRSKFRETFQNLSVLGEGNFGDVFSVESLEKREQFAMKRVPVTFDALADIRMILNESMILKKLLGHPNIVRYYDSWLALEFEDDEDGALVFYLQMELCGCSLASWKLNFPNERLDSAMVLNILRQLTHAVEWIHSKGFLHLDINPKNILWVDSTRNSVKIVDFGLAIIGSSFNGRAGTVPYCPPESTLTAKSDIYSLGVTLFEISQNFGTRSELFHRLSSKKLETGISLLDDVLPKMLSKHSHRPTAYELKFQLDITN